MPLIRKKDGSWERAGKYRKVYDGDLSGGVKPSWLTEEGGQVSLGSVTFTASNDRATFTAAPGLAAGSRVVFSGVTGATGITAGTTYYVLTVSGNAVTVAATPGGTVIDITADGTATGSVGGAGVIAYTAATATAPGKATVVSASTVSSGWIGPQVDLSNERIRAVWFSVHDFSIIRATSGTYTSQEIGIRSVGSATAGVRFLSNFATTTNFPTMDVLAGGAVASTEEVRMPWGARVFEAATSPMALGDNPRPLSIHIDNRDKTVSLLMGDQVAYSRQRADLVRGVVQPRLVFAKTGSNNGDRTMVVEGAFEFIVEYD